MEKTKKTIIVSMFWRFAERFGAQMVTFVVSIILARLLDPDVYGTIALVNVFIVILQVFIDSGLGNALIQKKDADEIDFSSVFFTNLGFCIILYICLFTVAPVISYVYKNEGLTAVIRVLSLTIVFSGVKNVQQAYVSRNMLFKKFFFATLSGTVAAAIAGIILAYCGFGVWALVCQHVMNTAIDTIVLWITVEWKPKKAYSFQRLKKLYSYGWKLLCSSMINTIYDNVRSLIIGLLYSKSDLAFYNRGNQIPNIIISNVNSSLDSILFPVMSEQQDDRQRVKMMLRKTISVSTYIMAPMMIGMAVMAPEIVTLILTEKWLPCVPYMRIFCVIYIFYPIHTGNLNSIKALGRSDLVLKQEVFKKVVGFVLLLISMWFGTLVMAYSLFISSLCNQVINSWPNRKLLDYSYMDQIKDIVPNVLLSLFMGVCIWILSLIRLPSLFSVIMQIAFGVIIYIAGSIITKNDCFNYLWNFIRPMLVGKKGKM